ncbi:MAG: hypothetical protein ACK50P_14855, partial [Planctomycetaceae bacterium]
MSRGSSEAIPPVASPPILDRHPEGVRERPIWEPDAGFVATIHVANHLEYGAPTVFPCGLRPHAVVTPGLPHSTAVRSVATAKPN